MRELAMELLWSVGIPSFLGAVLLVGAIRLIPPYKPSPPEPPDGDHVGATADWSPSAEYALVPSPAQVAHCGPDSAEAELMDRFDDLGQRWSTDPDWLAAWRTRVDESYQSAGLYPEGHRRWRARVLDQSDTHAIWRDPDTGELRVVNLSESRR